jgi:hypothetical protein
MDNVYAENVQESYIDAAGNLVQRNEEVFDDSYQRRLNILDRTEKVIYFMVAALEVLLTMRLIFRLMGADAGNGLVNFVYNLSKPFVITFNGIFSDQEIGKSSVFEFSTLIAIIMYALLAWGVVALIYVLFEPNRSSRSRTTTTRHRRV